MYKVFQVFEPSRTKFYVVNMQTKKIQSVWTTWIFANKAAYDLNQRSA